MEDNPLKESDNNSEIKEDDKINLEKKNLESAEEKFEKIKAEDEAKIKSLLNTFDSEKQKEDINNRITEFIEDYNNGNKSKNDFEIFMKRILLLKTSKNLYSSSKDDKEEERKKEYYNNIDRSWSQDQTDFIIEEFNKHYKDEKRGDLETFNFLDVMSAKFKIDPNEETVNEQFVRSVIELIDNSEEVSLSLQKYLALKGQNIQMIRSKERFDLVSKILENPGKIYNDVKHEMQAGMSLMNVVSDLEQEYKQRKNNTAEVIKLINVLDFLTKIKYNTGFGQGGEEAGDLLKEISEDNDNYFVNYKLDLLKEKKGYNFDIFHKYNDIKDKSVEPSDFRPILFDGRKQKELQYYAYSRLSEGYGVIYNKSGEIDSFLELSENNQEKDSSIKRKINLNEILQQEGLSEEDMSSQEYQRMITAYKTLINPVMRDKIETEFDIKTENYSIREQIQFAFLLSYKKTEDMKGVKDFLDQSLDETDKKNRVKSFLSMEADTEMGERILQIGRSLEKQPSLAEKLFSEFSRMAESVEAQAKEILEIYDEIFYEKKPDKNKLKGVLFRRTTVLLWEISEELYSTEEEDKADLINTFISKFRKENETKKESLDNFKNVAKKMNKQYKRMNDSYISFLTEKEKEGLKEDMRSKGKSEENIEGTVKYIEDYLQHIDSLEKNARYNEPYLDADDIHREMLKEEEKDKHFDSKRIRDIIKEMEGYVEEEPSERVQGLIDDFKKYLKYQENFENKFEKLVYGQESASLPENFDQEIVQEIENYQSELPDSDKKPYLPVGISSLLPKEGEVHAKPIDAFAYMLWLQNQDREADFMVVDTIQESNYQSLHGLDREEARKKAKVNGQRDEQWYRSVKENFNLDNIEFADYSGLEQSKEFEEAKKIIDDLDKGENRSEIISGALDNLVEKSIKDKASPEEIENLKEYGKKEIAFIIARKDLKISHEKEYRYDIMARIIPVYKELKDRAEELKDSRRGYLEQKNVQKKKIGKELKKLESDESLVELSLYLSYYGDYPKTYHLSADIFGTEERARGLQSKKNKSNKDIAKAKELKIKATNLRGQMTSLTSQYEAEEEKVKPIDENINNLGLLKRGTEAKHVINKWRGFGESIKKEDWFRNLDLPEFYYPKQITGMSFEMQDEKNPGYTSFREFYSTYKGESEEELPIEANQVIASTSPLAASKLLVLDEKKQREYYEKVLKPLLVNYYLATSKDKEEASKRFEQEGAQNKTISEIIHFIQNNIVKPVEKDLQSSSQ